MVLLISPPDNCNGNLASNAFVKTVSISSSFTKFLDFNSAVLNGESVNKIDVKKCCLNAT